MVHCHRHSVEACLRCGQGQNKSRGVSRVDTPRVVSCVFRPRCRVMRAVCVSPQSCRRGHSRRPSPANVFHCPYDVCRAVIYPQYQQSLACRAQLVYAVHTPQILAARGVCLDGVVAVAQHLIDRCRMVAAGDFDDGGVGAIVVLYRDVYPCIAPRVNAGELKH